VVNEKAQFHPNRWAAAEGEQREFVEAGGSVFNVAWETVN